MWSMVRSPSPERPAIWQALIRSAVSASMIRRKLKHIIDTVLDKTHAGIPQ
jgi:hypothetical protein